VGARIEAHINPDLLVWARESAGFGASDAASKLKISIDRLQNWETSRETLSIPQLRKLAELYKRPIAVFYLPERPKNFQALHDFRRLPDSLLGAESHTLRLEIRKAQYRREAALEIYSTLGEEPAASVAKTTQQVSADDSARMIRAALHVRPEDQLAWHTDYEALNGWRRAAEGLGILVFQATGVSTDEMRGFSLVVTSLPVIVLNIKDSVRARIFTLLHELAHLMLREEGVCDLDEGARQSSHDQQVEVYANEVAGEALVPREMLTRDQTVVSNSGIRDWSDEAIEHLSKRYWVSREVIVRRFLVAGLIGESFYKRKRDEYEQQYRSARKVAGFVLPHTLAISRAGDLFANLVLDGYAREKLTSRDVSDLLDVRLKHQPRIQQALLQRSDRAVG
jgi:Zn-dependent peptidase ImmA (M78 family)